MLCIIVARASCEHGRKVTRKPPICLVWKCLTEKCLTTENELDTLRVRQLPRRGITRSALSPRMAAQPREGW